MKKSERRVEKRVLHREESFRRRSEKKKKRKKIEPTMKNSCKPSTVINELLQGEDKRSKDKYNYSTPRIVMLIDDILSIFSLIFFFN